MTTLLSPAPRLPTPTADDGSAAAGAATPAADHRCYAVIHNRNTGVLVVLTPEGTYRLDGDTWTFASIDGATTTVTSPTALAWLTDQASPALAAPHIHHRHLRIVPAC